MSWIAGLLARWRRRVVQQRPWKMGQQSRGREGEGVARSVTKKRPGLLDCWSVICRQGSSTRRRHSACWFGWGDSHHGFSGSLKPKDKGLKGKTEMVMLRVGWGSFLAKEKREDQLVMRAMWCSPKGKGWRLWKVESVRPREMQRTDEERMVVLSCRGKSLRRRWEYPWEYAGIL